MLEVYNWTTGPANSGLLQTSTQTSSDLDIEPLPIRDRVSVPYKVS